MLLARLHPFPLPHDAPLHWRVCCVAYNLYTETGIPQVQLQNFHHRNPYTMYYMSLYTALVNSGA
jgi:hypothetical protein